MTELVVSFEVDGRHFWPNAPEKYKEFRQSHRHLFKCICTVLVRDSDDPARRDVELWELRQQAIECARLISTDVECSPVRDFRSMSCEGIASALRKEMGFSKVFVGEDVNFGAIVS